MKIVILALTLTLVVVSPAAAIDTSTGTGRSERQSKDKSMSQKRSEDRTSSAEVTLSMDAVFRPVLLDLEKSTEPWRSCSVLSHPLLAADIGLSAEDGGVIDTVRAEYINQAAAANMPVAKLADETVLRKYRACLALYGSVVGQAYKRLSSSLPKVAKIAEGKSVTTISGLNREDLQALASIEVEKTIQASVKDKRIRKLYYSIVGDEDPCRFGGQPTNLVCGRTGVILGPKPQLFIGGVEFYGERFAGYSGHYQLRAARSESRDKVLSIKKAWEQSRKQDFTISIGKLIPGIHE